MTSLIASRPQITSKNAVDGDRLAVALTNVSVYYTTPVERIPTLKEHLLRRILGHRTQYREHWALRDVSLRVNRGESLGIIGNNGAGKSTLLKVVARVIAPRTGRLQIRGTVLPLLQLGAGFNNELTGRENIFLYGSILGMTRTIMRAQMDSIIDFSGLGEYIDSPLRTYSSGMKIRLGFAIASSIEPEILLVDEVLAVGDMAFQQKCRARIDEFRGNGCTILFVSHSMASVREICTTAAWIDHGELRAYGAVDEVSKAYEAQS